MSLFSLLIENLDVVLFYSGILLLVYFNRSRLKKDGIAYLLKTKFGLKLMDTISSKHRKLVKIYGYIGIVFAYLGFFVLLFTILPLARDILLLKPDVAGAGPALPGFEIPGTGIKIPLIAGWIALLLTMIVHEFSHGVVARAHKQKVKSSGIGVVGPLPVAFVELDEKNLVKQPHRVQHSVFAAGPFANVLLFLVALILMFGVGFADNYFVDKAGVQISINPNETLPAYMSGLPEDSVIVRLNNNSITTYASLNNVLDQLSPNQNIIIETKGGNLYNLVTTSHPDNESWAYIGIYYKEEIGEDGASFFIHKIFIWLAELLYWTFFLSINIGLFNLFPIFITDGARMLKLNLDALIKKEDLSFKIWKYINYVGVLIVGILLINFFIDLFTTLFSL